MSLLTRTTNLYPAGILIVGCTFKLRRVRSEPVRLSSSPMALDAVCDGLGATNTRRVYAGGLTVILGRVRPDLGTIDLFSGPITCITARSSTRGMHLGRIDGVAIVSATEEAGETHLDGVLSH